MYGPQSEIKVATKCHSETTPMLALSKDMKGQELALNIWYVITWTWTCERSVGVRGGARKNERNPNARAWPNEGASSLRKTHPVAIY